MGMDLYARNKAAGDFHWGAFGWSWMLAEGVGLPVGHFPGLAPGEFIYNDRPDGKSLGYNDGARVSAKEAKDMAKMARWIAAKQRAMTQSFESRSAEEQAAMREDRFKIYTLPVRQDWVEQLDKFADWAEKSGGFRVC